MSFLDAVISKIAPYDCLECGIEGDLLCRMCINKLISIPESCYGCHQLSEGSLTCLTCGETTQLGKVQAAAVYSGLAKDLVWKLKSSGAQAAAKVMAARMAALVSPDKRLLVVGIPTATSRVRERGYDQAKLLARKLAREARLPYADCLARSGQAHQVGSDRSQRLSQLTQAFRVTRLRTVQDAHILLVDDVLTTGSTLQAAARVLSAAGAARIDAIVFARTAIKKTKS